jgi:hypothetical protein
MSSGAAQLPSHCGGVMGLPSAADAATRASFGCPSGGRRRRGRPGCPDACHAVRRSVRVRCPPCGRTSVQLVGWTSGVRASGVHASGVHAPGVHTTGVIRVSGRTRVRCPRPLQRAGSGIHRCGGTGHGWCTGFDGSLWSVSGLVVAARIGPGGQKMVERWPCVARTRVDARLGAASQASRLRRRARRLADQGSRSRARCRSVGGGAGEEQVLPSPRRCVLGGLPACWPTMGWTGRW